MILPKFVFFSGGTEPQNYCLGLECMVLVLICGLLVVF